MSYSLTIELRDTYLFCSVTGENTLKNVLSYLDEIYAACIQHHCTDVVIVEDLKGANLDTFDIFVVITKNFTKALSLGVRLAYVDNNIEHSKRGLKFAENLAHIRGVNVRLFETPAAAENWMQQLAAGSGPRTSESDNTQ